MRLLPAAVLWQLADIVSKIFLNLLLFCRGLQRIEYDISNQPLGKISLSSTYVYEDDGVCY